MYYTQLFSCFFSVQHFSLKCVFNELYQIKSNVLSPLSDDYVGHFNFVCYVF